MYKVVFLSEEANFSTHSLKEAIKYFFETVKSCVKDGTMVSYQQLETGCWLESDGRYMFDFYQARDYGYNNNWISKGNWVNG